MQSGDCQKGPPLDYDETALLCHYITRKTSEYGDLVAQIDAESGATLTFKELHDNSDKLCSALLNHWDKVIPGDVIAIITANCTEYVWLLLGVFKAKACGVLVNSAYTPREIQYNFSVSRPKIVICSHAVATREHVLGSKPADVFARDQGVSEVWVFGCPEDTPLPPKCRLLGAVMRESGYRDQQGGDSATLTALLLSSSGSTGLPKCVMLSNRAVVAALHTGHNYVKRGEIALGLMPFYHAYGLVLMLMCLCEGGCVVVVRKFAVDNFVETIRKYKVNNLYLVPSLLALLSKRGALDSADLDSVRHIWTGAAPVSARLQDTTRQRFLGRATLHHSYGMTETTFTMFTGEFRPDKPGSPGMLTAGVECKVGPGTPRGPNAGGELCFRSPLLMQGYKDNEEATREMIDDEGWLHSGDLGYYDKDGYFYVVDRLKEIIKYQGHQVSPSELESILITHEGVADVAVVGVPHEALGELPRALVVRREGSDVSCAQLEQFLAAEVSPHKRLHGGVKFVEEIPKTGNGKILRRVLKDIYSE